MAWKVRADCTFTTAANKTTAQTSVTNLLSSYSDAVVPPYAASIGRFPGGITSQSTTRFTVAYDFSDSGRATAFVSAVHAAVAAVPKSQTLVSVHEAKGF